MLTETLEPPRDANGVPILPGYRKPFTTESAKRYSLKALEVRTHNRQARLLAAKPQMPSSAVEIAAMISATLRQYRRCMSACVASTNGKDAAMWARAAKDALECWQSILGNRPNSAKNHKLRKSGAIAPIPSIQPISPAITPPGLPQGASLASGLVDDKVKPVATPLKSNQSTKTLPEPDDDCPF